MQILVDEDEACIYPCIYRRLTHPVVENRKKLLIILCKTYVKFLVLCVLYVLISKSSPDRVAHKLKQYVLYALWMMRCVLSIVGSC